MQPQINSIIMLRNIDVMRSLIPICEKVFSLDYDDERICEDRCAKISSSEYNSAETDFAFSMINYLFDIEKLLKMISPEYVSRLEDYEVDYEALMQCIEYSLKSPQQLYCNLDIIFDHLSDLEEMCELEVADYLLMTHPINHTDLRQIKIVVEGDKDNEWGVLYRTATQSE